MSWNREKVEAAIKEILVDNLFIEEEDIEYKCLIEEDLMAGFLELGEIFIDMAEKFRIMISDEEEENIKTFQDAVEMVCNKLNVTK